MGGEASNNFQSDRPESGGADRDMIREKSGLLERDKQTFASDQAAKDADSATKASRESGPPVTSGDAEGESQMAERSR